ncbi:hypothetical protein [Candidatus Poriferisodalis sp.]
MTEEHRRQVPQVDDGGDVFEAVLADERREVGVVESSAGDADDDQIVSVL